MLLFFFFIILISGLIVFDSVRSIRICCVCLPTSRAAKNWKLEKIKRMQRSNKVGLPAHCILLSCLGVKWTYLYFYQFVWFSLHLKKKTILAIDEQYVYPTLWMNCSVEHKLRLLSDADTFFDCFSFLWLFLCLEILMKADDGKKFLSYTLN